jgi:hypothetical protein
MANRERGEASITIEDKAYTLALTTNAMCEAEALLSTPDKEVSFQDLLRRVNRNSVSAIRVLVWASLREHHPDLTLKDVGNLIQKAGGVVAFGTQLSALSASTRPDPADAEATGRPH